MRAIAILVSMLAAVPFSVAATGDGGTHRCARVVEPVQRLACYDQAFPPPGEVIEAAAQRAESQFGLERKPVPITVGDHATEAIEAAVVSIARHRDGGRIVGLDNGQIWWIVEETTRGPLADGDRVRVRKGALGSHMLVTPGGVSLRVRRLK